MLLHLFDMQERNAGWCLSCFKHHSPEKHDELHGATSPQHQETPTTPSFPSAPCSHLLLERLGSKPDQLQPPLSPNSFTPLPNYSDAIRRLRLSLPNPSIKLNSHQTNSQDIDINKALDRLGYSDSTIFNRDDDVADNNGDLILPSVAINVKKNNSSKTSSGSNRRQSTGSDSEKIIEFEQLLESIQLSPMSKKDAAVCILRLKFVQKKIVINFVTHLLS